ncbi:SHOCT domain-containing protein [Sphaerisporangium sp. NPDC004334]
MSEEMRMMYWNGPGMGWGYGLMILNMVLFWGLVIAVVVLLFRYLARRPGARGGSGPAVPAAEDVLAQRYARGEIDAEEYHARLQTLRGARPPGD